MNENENTGSQEGSITAGEGVLEGSNAGTPTESAPPADGGTKEQGGESGVTAPEAQDSNGTGDQSFTLLPKDNPGEHPWVGKPCTVLPSGYGKVKVRAMWKMNGAHFRIVETRGDIMMCADGKDVRPISKDALTIATAGTVVIAYEASREIEVAIGDERHSLTFDDVKVAE